MTEHMAHIFLVLFILMNYLRFLGLPWWLNGKESTYSAGESWVGKSLWRRKWQPTPVFLPGKSMDRGAQRPAVHGAAKVGQDLVTKPPPSQICYTKSSSRQLLCDFEMLISFFGLTLGKYFRSFSKFLAQAQKQSFLQGTLVPFRGEWYL